MTLPSNLCLFSLVRFLFLLLDLVFVVFFFSTLPNSVCKRQRRRKSLPKIPGLHTAKLQKTRTHVCTLTLSSINIDLRLGGLFIFVFFIFSIDFFWFPGEVEPGRFKSIRCIGYRCHDLLYPLFFYSSSYLIPF